MTLSVLLMGAATIHPGSAAAQAGAPGGQQLAVAAYIHPQADPAAWERIIKATPGKVGIMVANVLNGPDHVPKDYWTGVIKRAHAAGIRVLGYVDTGYLGTTGQRTRLGSTSTEDWIGQIELDINTWYAFYGADLDGIFFDQGQNVCGPTPASSEWVELYRHINRYEKENHPGGFTVLNPGTPLPPCYEDAADVLLTFEGSYLSYVGRNPDAGMNYQPLSWTPADAHKIWHIIFGANQAEALETIELSASRGAGYVFVTDDVLDNPYDSVPEPSYWEQEQAAVPGGPPAPASVLPPHSEDPSLPTAPSPLIAFETDYTSTQLEWTEAFDADNPLAGYDIYANGVRILTLPPSTNNVMVGGLPAQSSTEFSVRARDVSGHTSAPSNTVSVTTLPLPGGQTLTGATVQESSGSIALQADFLAPYAFHRIFITTTPAVEPCWWTGTAPQYCAAYVIENGFLFSYAGTGGDWAWKKLRPVAPVVDGYSYAWTISPADIGTPGALSAWFNGEGYAPMAYLLATASEPQSYTRTHRVRRKGRYTRPL